MNIKKLNSKELKEIITKGTLNNKQIDSLTLSEIFKQYSESL